MGRRANVIAVSGVSLSDIQSHLGDLRAAAAQYGISRQHLHRLLARYRDGGLDDLEPRSRRPHYTKSRPVRTPSWRAYTCSQVGQAAPASGWRSVGWRTATGGLNE